MPYRILGRTGERVSAIGLGGWHLGLKNVDEELSVRIVRHAVDRGINFLDNSWDYNDGASEIRMGKALRDGYRNKVFLMTKIDGRSKAEAKRQLDESLRRLGTDRLDLVQHHEIIRYEDPHRIFDEEGAHGALVEARQRIGVLGMKSMANGIILKSGTVTAIECLHYALGLPTSVVITGIESMERLEQAFEAARTFRPMDAA
jgi:aryl-alcohol dehydrogenase-like predicted oxidoreductase